MTEYEAKLTNRETTLSEAVRLFHKCPWYIRWFNKERITFDYIQQSSGIGLCTTMICKKCGEKYNITDVHCW